MNEPFSGASRLSDMSAAVLKASDEEEHRYFTIDHPGGAALALVESLQARPALGMPVNLYRHSLQTATRCLEAGECDELVTVALLHDIGEAFSPVGHGEISAAILGPFISDENQWLLRHHAVFQEYYFADRLGRDRLGRERYRDHPFFAATLRFCERYDQTSFDPEFRELPLSEFRPLVRRLFAREPRMTSE